MNFIDKLKEKIGTIDPRYDMSAARWKAIVENATDLWDAVSLGFEYGYLQGAKATEAEYRKKPVENPQKVKDLRQAIIYTANKTRNSFALQDIYKTGDLLWKRTDDREYATLTCSEWKKAAIISHIVQSDNDENIKHVDSFIRGLEMADRKRRNKVAWVN